MLIWALPVLGGLVFLGVLGRYNLRTSLRDWMLVLSPASRETVTALASHVELDAFLAGHAHSAAVRSLGSGELEEAVRLLDLAASVIVEAVPDRLTRLRGMAVCCRMASALLPLPPLAPRDFRLWQIVTLAGLGTLAHHFLVSMGERFLLRLWLMGLCYRIVKGVACRSAGKARREPHALSPWRRFEAALADFKTLDREHVESFRALMMSLAAEPVE